jgi:anti-sigma factor RsiW
VLIAEDLLLLLLDDESGAPQSSYHEEQVRRSLAAALVDGQDPDPRSAALIALLSALDRAHKTVDRGELSAREVRRRAKEIADGNWAAQGVRDAIQAATAAMTAAAAGGAAAAASGS